MILSSVVKSLNTFTIHKPNLTVSTISSIQVASFVIKTELLTPNIDFRNWYYINDPTHTIFYSPNGINRLLNQHGFQCLDISPRLVIAKRI